MWRCTAATDTCCMLRLTIRVWSRPSSSTSRDTPAPDASANYPSEGLQRVGQVSFPIPRQPAFQHATPFGFHLSASQHGGSASLRLLARTHMLQAEMLTRRLFQATC